MAGIVGAIVDNIFIPISQQIAKRNYARTDRRNLAEGRTRLAVRAREGRVLNIGTEWSEGTADITPGHAHFEPRIGVVGDRDIHILDLKPGDPPQGGAFPNTGFYSYFEVTTPRGVLLFGLPETQARQIVAPAAATEVP